MSFKQFLCYSVICDGCGKDSNAGEEIAGWLGKAEAEDVKAKLEAVGAEVELA